MAIQITNWRPDTCGCEVRFSWDDSVSSELRTHTLHSIVVKCPFHQTLSDNDSYTALKDENQTKNLVLGHVLINYPTLVDTNADGTRQLKPQYTYSWSFDVNRKLQADFLGVDKITAEAIQASLNIALGSGKVDVKIP